MADIDIDTVELEEALTGIRIRAQNVDKAVLGVLLLTAIDDVIQSEGAAGAAGAWEPFAPSTRRRRGSMGEAKLLQDTGLLANMQLIEGLDYITAYSPADYAIHHVEGHGDLPVRDPFDINQDQLLADVEEIILDDIVRGVSG